MSRPLPVQSPFVPKADGSLSAVVVSGGKQYRVAPGDRILVDRLPAEPGAEVVIDRVLMIADGDDLKLGADALKGQTVTARVVGHPRGPKIDVLRYKSKKRVRVHRGARADLTALEIVAVGDAPAKRAKAKPSAEGEDSEPKPAKPAGRARKAAAKEESE